MKKGRRWAWRLPIFLGLIAALASVSAGWAQASVNQIPQPPAVPPISTDAAIYYAYFTWAFAALVLGYILRESWRTHSLFPLAFTIAGAIGVFAEPVYDSNMHDWFAHIDAPMFQSYNIAYPWYALIGESIMAGPIYWMYQQFQGGVTTRGLWGYFLLWWLYQMILEIPGNLTNSYIYYGNQPFVVLGFPLWLGVCLAFGIPLTGYIVHRLTEVLSGLRLWLAAVIMIPATLFGSQLIGWPMWVTLNGGGSLGATHVAALVSVVFALCGYQCLAMVYAHDRARPAEPYSSRYVHA